MAPVAAQLSARQPYEVCEPQLYISGFPEAIHQGFNYPAWNSARFNPADSRQIAALRSELDSSGTVRRHLYLLNTVSHRKRRLVRDVGCALAWSSTGWLVFEQAGQLCKIRADGTGRMSLTNKPMSNILPAWSPNGRQLACLRAESATPTYNPYSLTLLSTTGQLVRALPLGDVAVLGGPAWSPDGQKIAFLGAPPVVTAYRYGIYEFDLKTERMRLLFEFSERPRSGTYSLQWLPGGKEIMWRNAESGLFLINVAAHTRRLAWQQDFLMSQDVDRQGSRLLVVHAESRLNPNGPNRYTTYLQTRLITSRLNGSGRIYLKF